MPKVMGEGESEARKVPELNALSIALGPMPSLCFQPYNILLNLVVAPRSDLPYIALPTRQTGSGTVIYYPFLLSLLTSIRSIAFLYNESIA